MTYQEQQVGPFLLRGLRADLTGRLKVYWSDYRDALHVKILASTLFIFFTSILPAITFGVFLSVNTRGQIGTTEVRHTHFNCNSLGIPIPWRRTNKSNS
jgi:hypothetical protein